MKIYSCLNCVLSRMISVKVPFERCVNVCCLTILFFIKVVIVGIRVIRILFGK